MAAIAVASALMVITSRNAVHSALSLIVTLLALAAIFLQNGAEFLAGVQVFLYVGGIMVLFIFVIMLVSIEQQSRERQLKANWQLGVITSLIVGGMFTAALLSARGAMPALPAASAPSPGGNSGAVALVIFRDYLFPFELASVLLLVAMVGAVVMAQKRAA